MGRYTFSASDIDRLLRENDPNLLRRSVVEAARRSTPEQAERFCIELLSHEDFHVRGNAWFAAIMLARRKVELARDVFKPLIESAFDDANAYVSGQVRVVAETVERNLKWLIPCFDNGWAKCPNCGWRFATYHTDYFREGRHLRCRQRLRITHPHNVERNKME